MKGDIHPHYRAIGDRYFCDEFGQVFIEGDVWVMSGGKTATVCDTLKGAAFEVRDWRGKIVDWTPAGKMMTETLTYKG